MYLWYDIEIRNKSTLKDNWDVRRVEELDWIAAVLASIACRLDGQINSKTLMKNNRLNLLHIPHYTSHNLIVDILQEHRNNSFIHSGYFYSASTSLPLLRGALDTAQILCRSFMLKRHSQLQVKDLDLHKVPTWWLEQNSNPRPFGWKASILPMSHHAPRHYSILRLQGHEMHPTSRAKGLAESLWLLYINITR